MPTTMTNTTEHQVNGADASQDFSQELHQQHQDENDLENELLKVEAEDEAESPAANLPADRRQINWEAQSPSIFDLYHRWKQGTLNIQPRFQRRGVWDIAKRSKFIESILLDIPLPLLYLAEEADATSVVVDGQQRLTAVFKFLDGAYALQGLGVEHEINGKNFANLDKARQLRIESKAMNLVLIKSKSDESIKYNVFERLNTGAVQLNPQELRNCTKHGPFNDLVFELSEETEFQKLCGFQAPHPRMKDAELVLRFLALHYNYAKYNSSVKQFLDDEMNRWKELTPGQAKQMRQTFLDTIRLARSVFGEQCSRMYQTTPQGGRWSRAISVALQDAVLYGFSQRLHRRREIMQRSDAIREAMLNLLSNDQQFLDCITTSSATIRKVQYRLETWGKELDAILPDAGSKEPRLFSLELKKGLFQANAACQLCGQQIHTVDDAEVDHKVPYWKGGQTIPENAHLTHRYCNRARRDK